MDERMIEFFSKAQFYTMIARSPLLWLHSGILISWDAYSHFALFCAVRFHPLIDLLDFKLNIACPEGFEPEQTFIDETRNYITITHDVSSACKNSDLIVTDVWASMGQEEEQKNREQAFNDYQVTTKLMGLANDDALFMHCLPAHRGEEVSADVIDGSQSVVWDEAENRLHAQKALLEFLLLK